MASSAILNTGGRYNPGTDSWTATSITNAPDCPSAVTRQCGLAAEMIVWGGMRSGLSINTAGDTILAPTVGQLLARRTRPMPEHVTRRYGRAVK